jgi:RND family efflux transporter MFP subunit
MAKFECSRRSRTRLAAALSFLLLALLPALAAGQMGGPALVRVAVASLKDMASETLVPGTVVSRNDARLSAEVDGRLTRVADVGTFVAKGEVVAEIESTALRLQMAELEAEVTRAEARLRFLESEENRFEKLAQSNLAAITQLEQTQSDRDVARGDLQVAQARLEQTADRLGRTEIRAPFDGIVVERLMTPGERAVEGSNVVRLVDQQNLEVVARAPLEYFSFVRPGQLLNVRTGNREALVEVRTVVAVGDENTHQFELRLDLVGTPFPVGQTLRVAVPTSDSREVVTVPRDALVLRPEGHSIFIVDAENRAHQVNVTVGTGQGDDIEVLGGVSAGDRVVVRGNERLQPGQAVTVLDG